jgi:hypothetical protein
MRYLISTGNRLAEDDQQLVRLDHGSPMRSAVAQADDGFEGHAVI